MFLIVSLTPENTIFMAAHLVRESLHWQKFDDLIVNSLNWHFKTRLWGILASYWEFLPSFLILQ